MDFIKHSVKKGETLSKIATNYGFAARDWDKIYNHPKNAPLRKLRPDPDHIEPKDIIILPAIPGKKIDDELKSLGAMRDKLETMPLSVKKITMEAKRMNKEAMRITKSGQMIQSDIQVLRGMQALHKSEITAIDSVTAKAVKEAKAGPADSPKAFALFQQRQEALAKLINTLKTIDEADKHMRRDPKKAMFAIGVLNKDMVKIEKLTTEWTKAHNDALKEINGRMKELSAERKNTV
ncbi:N-acetylmuramoyl-L-alanine amidase [Sulfitobacter noctilucicola]|uniref:Murein DD-endopeptidase MepM/ murein hydrolase activator NlpD n=1 Tax=Sulfitobacter noctilucicola TaxID=1342301 RepID=A0A7W6M5T7_9RHOB|nr:LysM peptidoglycan-binding domain-containing protein [Sulfitobacter noctilucicola]KIN62458.1 N-acetylmuramoyl-L-alanine amidase [Sulfitobacter noctilucicola]MBB4173010.1 murein DD-endopeptidase MepM/ murein hydrolase activator NlpD [Sulfitobacter noctilucicola]